MAKRSRPAQGVNSVRKIVKKLTSQQKVRINAGPRASNNKPKRTF